MARKADQERKQAREKAEQELQTSNPELWQDYSQLSEDKKQLVLRETSKDYRAADEQAQSWGIGGNKSRAMNAVTSAVTGILGGQSSLQAATNALAPYAAELIGKQFGHGENQNQAAQLVAHALVGAISASVNGGNAAAGAVGASAAELAAQYLIKQLPKDQYPEAIDPITGEIDPNRLPENVKASIRDLSSAVATVSGGLTGGSLIDAQIAGVIGQNAVENNRLIVTGNADSKKRYLDLLNKTQSQYVYKLDYKDRIIIEGYHYDDSQNPPVLVADSSVGDILHPTGVQNKTIIDAINKNEDIYLRLISDPNIIMSDIVLIDDFLTGNIDATKDLFQNSDPNALMLGVIHYIKEREQTNNYEAVKSTLNEYNKHLVFNPGHQAGIEAELSYLKELYPNRNIIYPQNPKPIMTNWNGRNVIAKIYNYNGVEYKIYFDYKINSMGMVIPTRPIGITF
jgi:hypothetical protein